MSGAKNDNTTRACAHHPLKINIHFLTNVLYESFQKKIHSDFMSSVEIDDTSFLSKCTTHIKGAKCNIKIDIHFKSIELSGIGCEL